MAEQVIPLTTPSEAQRRQAFARFALLRPALEEEVSQTQLTLSETTMVFALTTC
jgi:hypothetical protein